MKLINEKTGKELKSGDQVETFRGKTAILKSFTAPHKLGSTGRVIIREEGQEYCGEYFPSVIGAKIIKD